MRLLFAFVMNLLRAALVRLGVAVTVLVGLGVVAVVACSGTTATPVPLGLLCEVCTATGTSACEKGYTCGPQGRCVQECSSAGTCPPSSVSGFATSCGASSLLGAGPTCSCNVITDSGVDASHSTGGIVISSPTNAFTSFTLTSFVCTSADASQGSTVMASITAAQATSLGIPSSSGTCNFVLYSYGPAIDCPNVDYQYGGSSTFDIGPTGTLPSTTLTGLSGVSGTITAAGTWNCL
jgi:hypothetical protein